MKIALTLMAVAVLVASTAFAHGNEEHVTGTVTKISEENIVVETQDKKPVTVSTNAKTRFVKSGASATLQALRVNDRVVIHAKKDGEKLVATTVRFGSTKH